jgi:hypothetical protein
MSKRVWDVAFIGCSVYRNGRAVLSQSSGAGPTGKSPCSRKNLSTPGAKNKSLRDLLKSALSFSPSSTHMRGVSRSSRTWGAGCDGRGASRDE